MVKGENNIIGFPRSASREAQPILQGEQHSPQAHR